MDRAHKRYFGGWRWCGVQDKRERDYLSYLAHVYVWLLERRTDEASARRAVLAAVTVALLRFLEQVSLTERQLVASFWDGPTVPVPLRSVEDLTMSPRPGPGDAVAAAAAWLRTSPGLHALALSVESA